MKSKVSPTVVQAITCVFVAVALIAPGVQGTSQSIPGTEGRYKSEETLLGPWYSTKGESLPVVSLDGRHVAYAHRGQCEKGSIMCVFLDGVPVPSEPNMFVGKIAIGPDGKRIAYESSKSSALVTVNQGNWVVIDGKREKGYDQISQILFSPDGKHLAYAARFVRGGHSAFAMATGSRAQWVVVLDGQESPTYTEGLQVFPMNLFFLSDGRLVYSAWREKKKFFVVDGKEIGLDWAWAVNPSFSFDGKRMAFVGCRGSGKDCSAVVDSKPGPVYDEIYRSSVFFSPDGQHYWYAGKTNGRWNAVVDGNPGQPYDQIYNQYCKTTVDFGFLFGILPGSVTTIERECRVPSYSFFSPDSKHTWYTAKKGGAWVAVEDGHEGPQFAEISANAFSLDSTHLAYATWESHSGGAKLLLDGKEIANATGMANPGFSPDGQHIAYLTYRSEAVHEYAASESGAAHPKRAVAVDGHAGAEFYGIGQFIFSPDSRHLAYSAQTEAAGITREPDDVIPGGKWTVVLDGQLGSEYSYVAEGTLKFGVDGVLEFLAARKDPNTNETSLYRVKYLPIKQN